MVLYSHKEFTRHRIPFNDHVFIWWVGVEGGYTLMASGEMTAQ